MMALLTYILIGLMVSIIIVSEGTIVDDELNGFVDKFVRDHHNDADEESIRTLKTILEIIWTIEWTLIWPIVIIGAIRGIYEDRKNKD